MPPIQPPPLDVRSYHIDTLAFRAFPQYDPEREINGAFQVDYDVQRSTSDQHAFRVIMRINVAKDGYTSEANPSHGISLTITGYFDFAEGTNEDLMQHMIRLNGTSILYGIARGIVGQATGASLHGQFVLPTVDFVEIARVKAASEASEASQAEVELAALGEAATNQPERT